LLRATATINLDAPNPARIARDHADDHLLSLAASSSSVLVSGDRDLLEMASDLPIYSPSSFLASW
jgi:predicted nucleic acid-binding protein